MRSIQVDPLIPAIYFKGYQIPQITKDYVELQNGQIKRVRFLKNFFSDIPFPEEIHETLFIKREYLELDIPKEITGGFPYRCFIREPHYYFFFLKYRDDVYLDINGTPITEVQYNIYKTAFLKGYWNGYSKLANEHLYFHNAFLDKYSLVETIFNFWHNPYSEDPLFFSFRFNLDSEYFERMGGYFGIQYFFDETMKKIDIKERNTLLDKVYQSKNILPKDHSDCFSFLSDTFLLQIQNAINLKKRNVFNTMSLEEAFRFIEKLKKEKNLKDERLISDSQLYIFFKRAFLGEEIPKAQINISSERGGKEFVYSLFYDFYFECIDKYDSENNNREDYIRLLTDNFLGFDFETVKRNFRKK